MRPTYRLMMLALGGLMLPAICATASAADLARFSGTWAYTAANCQAYLHDRIPNEARKRGAGLMIIRAAGIEWVTPATCEVSNLQGAGDKWAMDGKCEIKGRDFTAKIAITAKDAHHLSLRTEAAEFGNETHAYARCSTSTEWRAN
jgi:hypothetical protein